MQRSTNRTMLCSPANPIESTVKISFLWHSHCYNRSSVHLVQLCALGKSYECKLRETCEGSMAEQRVLRSTCNKVWNIQLKIETTHTNFWTGKTAVPNAVMMFTFFKAFNILISFENCVEWFESESWVNFYFVYLKTYTLWQLVFQFWLLEQHELPTSCRLRFVRSESKKCPIE